ncbi:MAG: glutamate-5-semialdehyde dehydrogenase, partial [Solirubrobacteraceae bacterium]|nr:glutamate-5-semialdehyde dehydrogenase [Solirubrobacteraceae bacterium]
MDSPLRLDTAKPLTAAYPSPVATVARSVSDICLQARDAARSLAALPTDTKNAALLAIADALIDRSDEILEANARDMEAGRAAGLDSALLDRLALDPARIAGIAAGTLAIA